MLKISGGNMERLFSVSLLKSWGLPYEAATPLEGVSQDEDIAIVYQDEQFDSSRWSAYHDLVFVAPDDRKMYEVQYSIGLTEELDESPWEYLSTVIGAEVEPYEIKAVAYREVRDGLDEDHDHALV
jgi:hypothetical protein